jgi:hypothetical protein
MMDCQRSVPFFIEIFADKAPVAVMRRGLRAKEARAVEHLWLETVLDLAF